MASVAPPKPSYRPHLPEGLVEQGLLSDAQLESVIYAGEAHSGHLAGSWTVDATFDKIEAAPDDCETAIRFRKGWFLGDGTGAGKGRQVAGVLLDNWLKGRRRAVWISKSDKLLEDAQRDWRALGQEPLLIQPLARFRQGTPIRLEQGILFTTYATLRSDAREGRVSRVQQIVDWLGSDFDGVIIFDESHAMQNAGGGKSDRGDGAPSQQGRAGLRLQHALPDARVLYVSATGATTVENLAYAQRLGLWGGADFPFDKRTDFVSAIEAGGVAAMEVLARDLKALGLYAARSLSYEGVEYELVEHKLTPDQVRIYDAYAGAFQVIHNNLDAALEASGVTSSSEGTLNRQAKSAARSAFESAKQRFFNHLITAIKTPTLIRAIEQGLDPGDAVKLRGDPPRVMRLSRKAIGIASACGFALVGGALIYALQPAGRKGAEELYNTDGVAVADNLAVAPKDYGQVPKLGPPLPGDLGKPILDAQRRGDVAALPPIGARPPAPPINPAATAADAARQRAEQEREAARGSRLFFGSGSPASGDVAGLAGLPPAADGGAAAPKAAPQTEAGRKQAFLERVSDRRTVSAERLTGLASPSILQAGSVIPAALITGIRSDLPGLVTAQVTQNVYDSPTGRILLIPQGSRLIGDYDADVAFGQSRVLLAWNRLILPDGRSIVLERQPASDTRGFAGLQDGTDFHWGGVLKAALVSTLLGAGSELSSGDDGNLARAFRRGTQDSINRAGEQIVSRELNVRPTLTIRPGFPVRVLVTRDLVLGGGQ